MFHLIKISKDYNLETLKKQYIDKKQFVTVGN